MNELWSVGRAVKARAGSPEYELRDVETLHLTDFDDWALLDDAITAAYGYSGDDEIWATGSKAVTLDGGYGNDLLQGGTGCGYVVRRGGP